MATLLLAEVAGGQLNDATARALTAALELGAGRRSRRGSNVGAAAEAAAKLQGVAKVLVADDPRLRARPGGAAGGADRRARPRL